MISTSWHGVTFTLVRGGNGETALNEAIDREESLKREEEIDRELRQWLRTHDRTDENYSDIYKDVHGVRPRW